MNEMTVQEILELRAQKRSWVWIDNYYGMPTGHGKNAANFLMRHQWREQAKTIPQNKLDEIDVLVSDGLTNLEISKRVGLELNLTAAIITLHDFRRDGRHRKVSSRKGVYRFSLDFVNDVKQLAEEGLNKYQITKEMGTYYEAVFNCCKMYNIKIDEKLGMQKHSPYDKELARQSLFWKVPTEVKSAVVMRPWL